MRSMIYTKQSYSIDQTIKEIIPYNKVGQESEKWISLFVDP